MPEYSAGKVTAYADGDRKVVDCGESEVGIFKIDGEFFAWHNRCAHRAGPVCQGRIMKRVIEPGPSAYADLAVTRDGGIICLYEAGSVRPFVTAYGRTTGAV